MHGVNIDVINALVVLLIRYIILLQLSDPLLYIQPISLPLTLRLLMSYIYIYIYIIYMEHLFLMFLDHTQRRTTVGRTPLDE